MDGEVSIPRGKVFVTGGSGHVGANLVRRLVADGEDVRCLVQPGADNRAFEGLDIERIEGDLRDPQAMLRAVQGCVRVFHVAAKVSTLNATERQQREIFDINVLGTRNVMRAALRHNVARAVLTGSFSAVGYDLDDPARPSNEDQPFYPFARVLPYARSKALAEMEALKCAVEGLDVVIATSCACVGPYDYLPSRMGKTLIDYAHGRLHAYVDGGFPFVAARDLVEGHLLAMEKGRRGHKYIFATEFHTLAELIQMWSELLGLPLVRWKLPQPLMAGITGFYAETLGRFFPNAPQRLTPGAIEILRLNRRADTSKARQELGFKPTTIREAVRDALEFFAKEGQIPVGMLREMDLHPT